MPKSCIFCEIVEKKSPSKIVYEDDGIMAFKNIRPAAPIHILIIPKKHIPSIDHLNGGDGKLTGNLLLVAKKIAKSQGLDKTGYKLVFNVGRGGGQVIDHLHLHLLGGWKNDKERNAVIT